MKTVTICLLLALAGGPALALAPVTFDCRFNKDDGAMLCSTTGMSEARRAPMWYVAGPGGEYVDKARGWDHVELWPARGEENRIIVQVMTDGRFRQLACTAPPEHGCAVKGD